MSDTNEVQIRLGSAKTTGAVEEQPSPAEELSTYVAVYGSVEVAPTPVYIHEDALRGIEEHAASSLRNEVGGALVGAICRSKGRGYVRIRSFVTAKNAGERRSELTFTHDTWSQLNAEREHQHPDMRIVGWYHTHPDLGVFVSDKDRFIHKNFFNEEGTVAMVIDPVGSDRAFFQSSDSRITKAPGFYVFGDVSRSQEIEGLIARLRPSRPSPSSGPVAPQAVPEVKVVFREPCINLYFALPGRARRLLGINDSKTAPRLSLKSLLIVILLGILIAQGFYSNKQQSSDAREAHNHIRFAQSFYNVGDYEEAGREYRRAQVLEPSNSDSYAGQVSALVLRSDVTRPETLANIGFVLGTLLEEARQSDPQKPDEVRRKIRRLAGELIRSGNQPAGEVLLQSLQANQPKSSDSLQLPANQAGSEGDAGLLGWLRGLWNGK